MYVVIIPARIPEIIAVYFRMVILELYIYSPVFIYIIWTGNFRSFSDGDDYDPSSLQYYSTFFSDVVRSLLGE